jgi:exodeoxyribonuclease VII small subunit
MSKTKSAGKESQTYQAMLTELDEIVRNVGQGQLDLDEIVSKIEHGYKLISTMRERLDTTKARVEKLRVSFEKADEAPSDKGRDDSSDDDDDDAPF